MIHDGSAILSMNSQAWLFLSTVLAGVVIGLFYDVMRIFRRTVPFLKKSFAVQLEDLFFWIAVTCGMFYFMLNRNFGEIRLFSMIGAAIGFALYYATVSRFVILIFVAVIEYLKKVFTVAFRIIFTPIRLIFNLISPPLTKRVLKVRSGLCGFLRYGKIRLKKTSRNWFILRKKV
ncbi:MAG: spore cortex biosynthesis protein YabQ [Defluviitaleaceae bacterium]|nr:spore cortex biosynthesis protein YabQ [Defluviitaleaceae bacterium]